MKKPFIYFGLFLILSIMACNPTLQKNDLSHPAYDISNMDKAINPGDDFFQFANGSWIKNNPIPKEYSRFGAFEMLYEENNLKLKDLIDELVSDDNLKKGSVKYKIATLFKEGMDTVKIDEIGFAALKDYFDQIDQINTISDVKKTIATMHSQGTHPLFNSYGYADNKNSDWVITQISQGGLGLPDRDYYILENDRFEMIRKEYVKHIAKMFELTGIDASSAALDAQNIMNLETRLAKASMTRLERRDPDTTYNKMDFEEFKKLAPSFDWENYFKSINVPVTVDINVAQPNFIREIGKMMNDIPVETWEAYLRWSLLNDNAGFLSSDLEKQNFEFYGKILSGKEEMRERWKRVLSAVNGSIGEGVGQLYVEKYFPPEAKERMINLVMNLKKALKKRIENLEWMGDETKAEAIAKLDKIRVKIAYPDKWKDYTDLEVEDDIFAKNIMRARKFATAFNYNKIGKPVDKEEWGMSPQTVNAYYSPSKNEIVFPAGILQFPFFNMAADDAVNYGAIGVVIGHEMTHGFDDQGRKFDKDGNMNDWWTEEDAKKFEEHTQLLVDQYNAFEALDSNFVDGKLTLGENIADFGGLTIAYEAYLMSLDGKEAPKDIDGLNYKQRFLLAFAQVWRQNIRDEQLLRNLKEDVHSPAKFRVNGPLPNMPLFYEAFDVSTDNALFIAEKDRAVIW